MSEFERVARTSGGRSVFGEVWYLLSQTKKWWLLPIVVILTAFALLIALSGTAAAPFIYTLF
jgi:hypothetical protein